MTPKKDSQPKAQEPRPKAVHLEVGLAGLHRGEPGASKRDDPRVNDGRHKTGLQDLHGR
jgi:hypothetical protein